MRARRTSEQGAIAVVAAVVLFGVGAFMALALNVGMLMTTRGQLQNASDSAALAAAGSLDGTTAGLSVARQAALDYSNVHQVTNQTVVIDSTSDVVFGRWHFKAEGSFSANTFETTNDPLLIDAVQLSNGRDTTGKHNGALDVFFSYFLGRDKASVISSAVAVGRGARTDCPMPFVLPSCSLQDGGGAFKCNTDLTLQLAPDGTDNVGFIYFVGGSGNADVPPNILNRCTAPVATASEYPVTNGNDLNDKVLQALLGIDVNGQNVTPIAPLAANGTSNLCIFNAGNDSFPIAEMGCPNPKFNQNVVVAQYARVVIKSVSDQNGNLYNYCPDGSKQWNKVPTSTGVAKRTLVVNVQCGAGGTGLTYNSGVVLRLVK